MLFVLNKKVHTFVKIVTIMAIAIKSIPILKSRAAATFTQKIKANSLNRRAINFSKQSKTATKILSKAKI